MVNRLRIALLLPVLVASVWGVGALALSGQYRGDCASFPPESEAIAHCHALEATEALSRELLQLSYCKAYDCEADQSDVIDDGWDDMHANLAAQFINQLGDKAETAGLSRSLFSQYFGLDGGYSLDDYRVLFNHYDINIRASHWAQNAFKNLLGTVIDSETQSAAIKSVLVPSDRSFAEFIGLQDLFSLEWTQVVLLQDKVEYSDLSYDDHARLAPGYQKTYWSHAPVRDNQWLEFDVGYDLVLALHPKFDGNNQLSKEWQIVLSNSLKRGVAQEYALFVLGSEQQADALSSYLRQNFDHLVKEKQVCTDGLLAPEREGVGRIYTCAVLMKRKVDNGGL